MNEAKIESLQKELLEAIELGNVSLEKATSKDPFRIVLCGAFSTGKTSLINALLGCELPTGLRPITKVVTCIRYGNQKTIRLENTVTGEAKTLSQLEANNLIVNKNHDSGLKDYRVCYELPAPFLKKGVEFLDTPGFQDAEEEQLDDMTKQAIGEADFCIVTFACNSFGDMQERQFLEELQKLSNGNFVCVLNCLNRVNSQEAQDDLQERANLILRECGNEQIGYGRYFMVDSDKYSEEKYLDGLDQWLIDLVKFKAASIRKDAAVSRGQSKLLPLIEKGGELFQEIQQEYETYMQSYEKTVIAKCHSMSVSSGRVASKIKSVKKTFFQSLDNSFCTILRNRLGSTSNYNDNASSVIANAILEYSNDLEKSMKRAFPEYTVPDPWEAIKQSSYTWTSRTTWTTRKSFTEYMSDGVNYGLWDWEENHVNDFIHETIKDTESKTIPNIKKHANEYFAAVEKKLVVQECVQVFATVDKGRENYIKHMDNLAEVLMEVRMLYTKLDRITNT